MSNNNTNEISTCTATVTNFVKACLGLDTGDASLWDKRLHSLSAAEQPAYDAWMLKRAAAK
jgi:hypothetical protein